MALLAGTSLGPYEILAPLGAGGMGEVYRARDTRLDRTVAIKVLPSELARDEKRRQRFEREARAVSQLSHPHICTLHDVGREDEIDFLVMECLEGESLADRLAKGRLPLDQTLRWAAEIADALDEAHRHGVVHRDLKPGNVMLTKSGAKLLDFGLARLRAGEPEADAVSATAAPTLARPLTDEGTVVGTYPYMAPEQLEGRETDARTDIFAFGAMLYEMATGQRAFEGKSRASLIAAILDHDPPPVSTLQPLSPAGLDHVVTTCLAKDPDDRWQSARDVRAELRWIAEGGSSAGAPAPVARRLAKRLIAPWALSLAAAVILTGWAAVSFRRPAAPLVPVRFAVHAPPGASLSQGAWSVPRLSPDGRLLAFHANDTAGRRIWVRRLDELEARPLAGTEDARDFFWLANSRSIAFDSSGNLMRVDVPDGTPRTLCEGSGMIRGGTENEEGVILFGGAYRPLHRVSSTGGDCAPATQFEESRQEGTHDDPQFLPGGSHFLYHVWAGAMENAGIWVHSLDTSEVPKKILAGVAIARYAPPDYLLSVREDTLMARRFDARRLEAVGEPVPVAAPVGQGDYAWFFSVSHTGALAFRPPDVTSSEFVWFDREGRELERLSLPPGAQVPELSPDGARLAFEVLDPSRGTADVWMADLTGGPPIRLTFEASEESDPLWSPDGSRLIFYSNDRLMSLPVEGARQTEVVHSFEFAEYPMSWSPDGTSVLVASLHSGSGDLSILPLSDPDNPIPFATTAFDEMKGEFSPDGRWIVYGSNESGRFEIYVQSFSRTGDKWRISSQGGYDARWRKDGKELFYISPDRTLMSVEVSSEGGAFRASPPQPLFRTRLSGPLGTGIRFNYAVHPDGERFLINSDVGDRTESSITVVLNWPALLEE